MLYKSTPEGAREFLVPSRMHHGQFYALPQSPQLFKQMLMIAGFDRYYQIVKCFRDEDLRADRQPEFTQIDIETSFLDELEIRDMMEGLVREMFREALAVELARSVSDPDVCGRDARLRLRQAGPARAAQADRAHRRDARRRLQGVPCGRRTAERPRRRAARSRRRHAHAQGDRRLHGIRDDLRRQGARVHQGQRREQAERGRAAVADREVPDARAAGGRSSSARGAATGDLIFFCADRAKVVNDTLGALRARIGHDRGLFEAGWKPLWVVDFPMFEQDEATGAWAARHHPFTAPKDGHEERFATDPGNALAKAYDVVLNGWEIGGGSVRIHRPDVQARVFESLGISAEDQRRKFGFLLDALQYGAPPHGGIAFGLDRIVTLMAGAESIRDVIAFPKTQRGQDLLVDAPAPVTEQQLRDLHIRIRPSDAVKAAG